jgi:hypothetical protein
MAVQGKVIFLILLIIGVHIQKYSASELCDVHQQIEYAAAHVKLNSNSMDVFGFHYPNGTFWKDSSEAYVGCPCLIHKCIQHCSSESTNS